MLDSNLALAMIIFGFIVYAVQLKLFDRFLWAIGLSDNKG